MFACYSETYAVRSLFAAALMRPSTAAIKPCVAIARKAMALPLNPYVSDHFEAAKNGFVLLLERVTVSTPMS